ncbi:DsbA family oxidoreductase [Paenibacillus sp. P96]|uniref:DsbA family oxidoreductase n=1 Tax=Paenibacillus zeirhizosphaerae TaxID=2987519 RepID=A0ABT9FVB9_9BACL|nr:DsbA family oxidoreductase [Paenibacillus sp. P96]MDP4098678.1 DsbA family oxidoreductase [Paenibacillus sp. P96]
MIIEVWSDYMCPFCFIGKRRLENALAQFEHKDEVKVQFRSFELNPEASRDSEHTAPEELAAKYGMSVEQAKSMNANVEASARTVGLNYNLNSLILTNSFDAHRLTHWADTRGKKQELSERLFKAALEEAEHIGSADVLADLAEEVGLDRTEAASVLAGNQFASEVRTDETQAQQLGITGVPFFVLDGKFAISGAQPDEVFADALQRAWNERSTFTLVESADKPEGAVCTEEGCEIPQRNE